MVNITLNMDSLQNIQLFERITKTKAVDCINTKTRILYIVPPKCLGKAVGKAGANAKRLRDILKKNVEIIEYSPDLQRFVRNLFSRFKVKEVTVKKVEEGVVVYVKVGPGQKARAIGMDGTNLRFSLDVVRRHFNNVREIYLQ